MVASDDLRRLLPLAPVVLGTAAFNAFGEEVIFRLGPLASLSRVVGPRQAVLMMSVWFGLGHYLDGIPRGWRRGHHEWRAGTAVGQDDGRLDTEGLGWPWITHVALDTTVFATIAVAAT